MTFPGGAIAPPSVPLVPPLLPGSARTQGKKHKGKYIKINIFTGDPEHKDEALPQPLMVLEVISGMAVSCGSLTLPQEPGACGGKNWKPYSETG